MTWYHPALAQRALDEDGREIRQLRAEIERLRALLKYADNIVIWEHTHARAGFQEEIEDALGITNNNAASG